ncbi:helix-turn-helix domain-containing protein [Pedobacter boryungensis]|uniref:Helix-turn-helix transcriptional regulator n=1 Tax=Pedobacter boryungensis TaxID=869962 RepID=A0ABX2DCB1_9SPHI|nr:helix-turn-helix transcriptional regulator [Pedobacter boryungensis]NQX31645.1 helix-turn-helix transcriptional regulator [Pedobacter boryungensis]
MLDKEQQVEFYEKIGERIKEARKLRDMNQDVLANALGISRVSLVNIEAGKQRPPLHVLLDICEFLNVTMNDLVPQNVTSSNSLDSIILNKIKKETDNGTDSADKVMNFILSRMKNNS